MLAVAKQVEHKPEPEIIKDFMKNVQLEWWKVLIFYVFHM